MAEDEAALTHDEQGRLRERIPLRDGRPHGLAETFDAAGNRLRAAPFVDGVLEGTLVEDEPGAGRRVVYTFAAGVLDGPARIEEHGRPLVTMAFVAGKLDGLLETFDAATGAKLSSASYRQGALDGPSIVYGAHGGKQRESWFRGGLLDGDVVEYAPDGGVKARQHYRGGMPVEAPPVDAGGAATEAWYRRWAKGRDGTGRGER